MINKAKIVEIKINNKNLRYKISNTFIKHLIGKKILKTSRRSKYLIFFFKKKLLLIHLGMSGKLLLRRIEDNKTFKTSFYYDLDTLENHNHIYFKLNNGLALVHNDVRRFGFFKLYNTTQLKKTLKGSGPSFFKKAISFCSKFSYNLKNPNLLTSL